MGQNSSSTGRRKSGVLQGPNLEVLFTEPANADYSPIRASRKASVERLFPTGPSINEINKAIKFVEDFLPLYTFQENIVPVSTSPLIAIDSRPLEYASLPAEIRIRDNVLRVVETTEIHAQLGQEIARTQAQNPYKRFSFANSKDIMQQSPKKSSYKTNSFSREISPPERSIHNKGSFGNGHQMQNNLNRSNRSNKSNRSNNSQQDTSRFADLLEEQQHKYKDSYQLSISPKTKKMNRPMHIDENEEPGPHKRQQGFPIHGSFGGDPLMNNQQRPIESISFRANSNLSNASSSNNGKTLPDIMENSRVYKQQNDLNTSKDLRARVEEEFNRIKGNNPPLNKPGSNMKRSNEQNIPNNYNDYFGIGGSQENLYGTQTLADNLHRQNKSPNSQQKNNWNMTQPISHNQNENEYYHFTPLKEGNYYNNQPRDPYRNNNLQESARGKMDQHSRSPRQDTNRSMLTPESSRANIYQSHLAKTGPVKKQEVPVLHHKLEQSGYSQMRKSPKAIPSPKSNGGSISTYAQQRQNNNVPAQKLKPDYDNNKRGGPLQFQKQASQQMFQPLGSQRTITPHPRPSNKDPYHNPQNLSTDYHYNQNNDIDMNPISVNLNLNELLEEADRSVSYSQTGGNPHNPKHSQYLPPHLNYTNPFNNNNPHQPTQSHSAQLVAPKHLEDTGFHDENSQFDKMNGSLVLSRFENQMALDDLHDNSMNHSIGQFNVNDSYTQVNNPSKYRNPAMNYQQQHMQLSGLNNNHNAYNPNINHMGGMAYD